VYVFAIPVPDVDATNKYEAPVGLLVNDTWFAAEEYPAIPASYRFPPIAKVVPVIVPALMY